MRISAMTTDGGPHPAWKHALVTADKLVMFSPDAQPSQAVKDAAFFLQRQIEQLLIEDHAKIEADEKAALQEHGHERLTHLYCADDAHVDDVMTRILALTKGTVLEAHFAKPDVQDVMRDVLHHEFATQQHVHRSWHADAHPHTEQAMQFRAMSPQSAHTFKYPAGPS